MTKEFRRGKETHVAVDGVSLDVRFGELFALLGHNGAGKTTIINCITGVTSITAGDSHVMGYSSITQGDRCRWNLAVCPQDSPMYEELRVEQHLRLFANLRGSENPESEVAQLLGLLGLGEKLKEKCKSLSGGQKRRLWVATSLLGKAPLVFLDEPTSGMDPASRRQLWNLLLEQKEHGRSVMFTTHYLEEADVLADRKAVLAKGKVKAAGSSIELKRQFGVGYHLRVSLDKSAAPSCADEVRALVGGTVAGSSERALPEEERVQSQDAPLAIEFDLPFSEMDSFGPLLKAVEAESGRLQILHHDISATSLEEVFMALGREAAKEATDGQELSPGGVERQDLEFQDLEAEAPIQAPLERPSFYKLLAIIFKLRAHIVRSNRSLAFWSMIYPLGFLAYMYGAGCGWGANWGYSMGGGFPFAPGLCIGFSAIPLVAMLVTEKESKVRHTMISQGLHPRAYWAGTLLHASVQTMFVSLAVPVLAIVFAQEFMHQGRWLIVFLAALLQPAPLLLAICHFSRMFTNMEVATKMLPLFVLFFAALNMVPWAIWLVAPGGKWDLIADLAHSVLSFVSPVGLVAGAVNAAWRVGGAPTAKDSFRFPQPKDADLGTWLTQWIVWAPFVGQLLLSSVLGYWLFVATVRSQDFAEAAPEQAESQTLKDDDVVAEERRIATADPSQQACLYRNLMHNFRGADGDPVRAVRGISLGIGRGECFGLLGPNGAGKTTTLSCLTGEIRPPTSGEVYVAGHAVTGDGIFDAFQHLGYCPQVDPIIPGVSGRHHLAFYAQLKGVPEGSVNSEVDRVLGRLGIEASDRDKDASKYSGGMKRKLALAQALIGGSDVLFLDEPSAAVDAGAKRLLWKVIKLRSPSQTVVITTHSMEEAEAVCDRVAIQVKGQLRCLGSPGHLKQRYGSGYRLEVALRPGGGRSGSFSEATAAAAQARLSEFVRSSLSDKSRLLEAHGLRCVYQLPPFGAGDPSLGDVFSRLQASREQLGVEDYSISQSSLEQVFLKFAQEQQSDTP